MSTGKVLGDALFFLIILMISLAACAWLVVDLSNGASAAATGKRARNGDREVQVVKIILPLSIVITGGIFLFLPAITHALFHMH